MKHKSVWIIGLGLGVAGLVLAIIVGGKYLSGELSAGKADTVASFVKTVDQYIAAGTLSPGQLESLKELAVIVKSKDASLATVLLSQGMVQNAMQDGQMSKPEYQNIVVVKEWLKKKKGNATFIELGQFYNDNPAIKDVMESLRNKPLPR
jgi:hypothetical protein